MQRVLFITKFQSGYCGYGHLTSGLKNSACFVSEMLESFGIQSKVVSVVDNNDIDREVHRYRPALVIIEALWVVPQKFKVLTRLHPNVVWVVRGHSDIPFLANEGIAIEWIKEYAQQQRVFVGWNDPRTVKSLRAIVGSKASKIVYLPNYYPASALKHRGHHDNRLRVGCFGAIRPMKNQLLQAVAAIRYAEEARKRLDFHINAARCEMGGEAILKNLRALFADSEHRLLEHGWLGRPAFIDLLQTMDISLAVSFSETFCIVAADSVTAGAPLICSDQVPWAAKGSVVAATDADAIVQKMRSLNSAWNRMSNCVQNRYNLTRYSKQSRNVWKALLKVHA